MSAAAAENHSPYTPVCVAPEDLATNVSVHDNLSWTGGDPDEGDTYSYTVYLGTSSEPPLVATGVHGDSYDPGILLRRTTYYWKIVTTDGRGLVTESPVWRFTTEEGDAWARTYGGPGDEQDGAVIHISDGGFLLSGATNSFGAGNLDAWLLKLGANGDVIGEETYGGTAKERVFGTGEGGSVAAGVTAGFGAGVEDIWVFKTHSDGSLDWQKRYGGAAEDDATCIINTPVAGGYLVAAWTNSFGAGSADLWLLKLTSDGQISWQKTYGGPNAETVNSVEEVEGGGYFLAGTTYSFGDETGDAWLLRLDNSGDIVWEKRFAGASGSYSDHATAGRPLSDGGFIVAGGETAVGAGGYDLWVLKLAGDGSIVWQKAYGGSGNDQAYDIRPTPDGGYLVAGSTTSYGNGGYDAWVLKLDADGAISWQETFGGASTDHAFRAQVVPEGGFVVVGSTESFGAGGQDIFVLRLDENGDIPGCPVMNTTNATVTVTSAVVNNTSATVQSTSVIPADTGATGADSSAVVNQVCLYDSDADPDNDGLPNYVESQIGTDPNDPDSDGDGISDGDEIIQGTNPNDADTDADGTPDFNDGCPSDPNKAAPGACGCGVADADTDGDGALDCEDACPADANKISSGACGCGVPDTDANDDGIWDCGASLPGTVDLGGADAVIYGGSTGDNMTVTGSVKPSDINGDGIEDIVVSAHLADPLGRADAGAVYVYFGKTVQSGVKDIAGLVGAVPDVTIMGAAAGDRLTEDDALCVADINGDGKDDLILGSLSSDPSGRADAGEAWVVFGSESMSSSIDLVSQANVAILGASAGDGLTEDGCIASGDVNGDGVADLVIGARHADPGGRADAGAVYIVYGSGSLGGSIDLGASGQNVIIKGDQADTGITNGGALSLGDLNGDGMDDIAFGGRTEAPFGAGAAYIVYGSGSLPDSIDINAGAQNLTVLGASADDCLTGDGAIRLGDVNGDGIDDLLLGAYGANPEGRDAAGEVYVVYGSPALSGTVNLRAGAEDLRIKGPAADSRLSYQGSLFAEDVNGDGVMDIVVGASSDDPEDREGAGSLYIVYGSDSLPGVIDIGLGGQNVWIKGSSAGDMLTDTRALAFGDVNGDGTSDLLFGSWRVSPSGHTQAGETYVVYGSDSLPPTLDLNAGAEDVSIPGISAGDRLTSHPVATSNGGAIQTGDFNHDGVTDILLGAYGADGPSEGRAGAGEAYVVFGKSPSVTATKKTKDHAGNPKARRYGTIRVDIDFESGDNLSTTVAKLNKRNTGLNLPNPNKAADVYWEISTDRVNYAAVVQFHYLDDEIVGLVEANLELYWSASKDGPWTKVTTTLDTETNTVTVSGMLNKFGFFILKEEDVPVETTSCFLDTLMGP
ncbi:MAG: hypothetical protein AB1921_05535 [Thermodesulfobacteriota bacterium]